MKHIFLLSLLFIHVRAYSQTPNLHWAYQNDGKSYYEDRGICVAFDSTGNILTAGYAESGCTEIDILVTKYNTNGDTLWQVTYNGSASEIQEDMPKALAIDAAGNVYVTGITEENSFYHAVTLKYSPSGNLLWSNRYLTAISSGNDIAVDATGNVYICGFRELSNNKDFMVIKYSASGSELWSRFYSNGNHDEALSLEVDATGNIYVTGRQSGVNPFYDWATVKYDAAGVQQWADVFGNSLAAYVDEPVDLSLDNSGNIYVAGFAPILSFSNRDYYVIKYSPAGARIWEASYNNTSFNSDDTPVDMEVDAAGNVFITGNSNGSGTGQDICTIKLNSAGNFVWENRIDSIQQADYARALVLDPTGNYVYVTGDISVLPVGFINRDIMVMKLDTAGNETAQYVIDGPGNNFDLPYDIDAGANGNIAITGMVSMNVAGTANGDVITGLFNSQLAPAWSRTINGDGFADDQGADMVVDEAGNTYVCGFTRGGDITYEDLVVFKVNAAGQRVWEYVYRGSEETSSERAVAIAIDQQKNVYVTGTTDTSTGNSYRDIYTAKLDPSGQLLWENTYNGTAGGADYPVEIAVDQWGVVYVAATTVNTATGTDATLLSYDITGNLSLAIPVDKGGLAETFNTMKLDDSQAFIYAAGAYLPPNGHLSDGLLVKFDWSGTVVWDTVYDYSPSNSDLDFFTSMDLDAAGNIFVAGQSNFNFVAAKYDPTGNPAWIQNYSHSNFTDSATVIAVDANGDVLVAGTFGQPVEADYGLVKYKNDGTLIWDRRYANSAGSDDILTDMVVDDDGNIYVTGWETSAFTTNYNFMTLKYDSSGTFKYELNWSGTNGVEPDYGKKIGLDTTGNIYILGDANENCFGNVFVNGFRWNSQILRFGQGVFSSTDELTGSPDRLKVYPNPASGWFNVKTPGALFGGLPLTISVFNIRGQVVYQSLAAEDETHLIDTSEWPAGMYFYRVANELHSDSGKIIVASE